ncbi:MAG TPA: GntR family transcriptional regulator [Thermomicrobiales bacterium]|nr:GntR family transcriptional regulator [Thermomicrobiales bacterium]
MQRQSTNRIDMVRSGFLGLVPLVRASAVGLLPGLPMTDHLAASSLAFSIAVDQSLPIPLYQQLSESLRRIVVHENWPVDYAIPSERELMRITGLSRMTVRMAIDNLTREGLLRRVHGLGTFVVPERLDQDLSGVYSFSQRMLGEGILIHTHVHEAIERPATPEEAEFLELAAGDSIFWLVRSRTIDGEPLVVNKVVLPANRFPGLLLRDLTGSLYGILIEQYDLRPLTSIDTLEAIAAPRDVADLLGVKVGAPVSLVRRVARTHGALPIEMTEEYARSDRMRYRLQQWADPVLERRVALVPGEVHA